MRISNPDWRCPYHNRKVSVMTRNDANYIRDLSQRAARRSDHYKGTDGWRQREAWRDAYVQLRAAALALELALSSEDK